MTTVIPKTKTNTQKAAAENSNPYDPQNPYKEPQSGPKDITVKDIQKDLIENDPLEGFQRDIDTQKSDKDENDSFETIAPEKDNPVIREFEIEQRGNEELKEDESTRDASPHGAPSNTKPSQRKF